MFKSIVVLFLSLIGLNANSQSQDSTTNNGTRLILPDIETTIIKSTIIIKAQTPLACTLPWGEVLQAEIV